MPNSGKKNGNNGTNGNHSKAQPFNFANKLIASVPHGRKGKHNAIVAKILADLQRLDTETAILVPLNGLDGEKIENVRSALNRATRQTERNVRGHLHGRRILLRLAHAGEIATATIADGSCSRVRLDGVCALLS